MRIFRAVIAGILAGAALFFLPFFILRGFLFIVFIGFIISFLAFGRFRRGGYRGRGFNPSFADNIRNMSDEEYNNFKQDWSNGCGWNNRSFNKPSAERTPDKQSS
jgi:hypothetical protein